MELSDSTPAPVLNSSTSYAADSTLVATSGASAGDVVFIPSSDATHSITANSSDSINKVSTTTDYRAIAESKPQLQQSPSSTSEPLRKKSWIMSAGSSILKGMERIGEVVAGVLGLDDAKFQNVYDSMTEEEKLEAKRINDTRNAGINASLFSNVKFMIRSCIIHLK